MSLSLPSCATYFFQYFRWLNLEDEGMASMLNRVLCDDGVYPDAMISPTYNFEKMGYKSRQFMLNMADTFVMIVIISFMIPFISILKSLLPVNKFLTQADTFMRGRFCKLEKIIQNRLGGNDLEVNHVLYCCAKYESISRIGNVEQREVHINL